MSEPGVIIDSDNEVIPNSDMEEGPGDSDEEMSEGEVRLPTSSPPSSASSSDRAKSNPSKSRLQPLSNASTALRMSNLNLSESSSNPYSSSFSTSFSKTSASTSKRHPIRSSSSISSHTVIPDPIEIVYDSASGSSGSEGPNRDMSNRSSRLAIPELNNISSSSKVNSTQNRHGKYPQVIIYTDKGSDSEEESEFDLDEDPGEEGPGLDAEQVPNLELKCTVEMNNSGILEDYVNFKRLKVLLTDVKESHSLNSPDDQSQVSTGSSMLNVTKSKGKIKIPTDQELQRWEKEFEKIVEEFDKSSQRSGALFKLDTLREKLSRWINQINHEVLKEDLKRWSESDTALLEAGGFTSVIALNVVSDSQLVEITL